MKTAKMRTKLIEGDVIDLGDADVFKKVAGHIEFPSNFQFTKSLNLSKGKPVKARGPVPSTDTVGSYRRRLAQMALDPVRRNRIRYAIMIVYTVARRPEYEDPEVAASEGDETNSLCMRIRRFHDELGLHVGQNVLGAVYRSHKAELALSTESGSDPALHQEHTIPSNIIAGMISSNLRSATLPRLAEFLLTETVVTAVTKAERKGELKTKRSCLTETVPCDWESTHPCYHRRTRDGLDDGYPFHRYIGTEPQIDIRSWLGETDRPESIDLRTYTLGDHKMRIKPYPLFDWRTYFTEEGSPSQGPDVSEYPTLQAASEFA